jgi:hypothetical protein
MELTGEMWIHTENDEFFNGHRLEQDPLYAVQGHLVHTFAPGVWLGAGIGYGLGAESTVNGVEKDDRRSNLAWGVSFGFPITRKAGFKIGYMSLRTKESVGANLDTVSAGFSLLW